MSVSIINQPLLDRNFARGTTQSCLGNAISFGLIVEAVLVAEFASQAVARR